MSTRDRDYAAERERARLRSGSAGNDSGSAATGSATATAEDAPAPFKKRSLSGTLSALTSSVVASSDPLKVTGDVECVRYAPSPEDAGKPGAHHPLRVPVGGLSYAGRLRIPRAKARGLIVGYEYRLGVPGDDVTAPLELVVKFVGTPEATPDVVGVDFMGRGADG